jgi:hypothetical protein
MGGIKSKTKYVLLYGDKGSGKTLLQYNMQSSLNVFEDLKSTEGFNYEEVKLKDTILGIFDISGDLKQYEIVNIITKCVTISGIIFIVPLENVAELDKSKALLKQILSNNYLKENLSLFIVYNIKATIKDKLIWMNEQVLNKRFKIDALKERFKLNYVCSCISDVSINNNSERNTFFITLEEFVGKLERLEEN